MRLRSKAFLSVLLGTLFAFSSLVTMDSAFSPVSAWMYISVQSSATASPRTSLTSGDSRISVRAYVGEIVLVALLMRNDLTVTVHAQADCAFVQGEELVKSSSTFGAFAILPGITYQFKLTLSDLRPGIVVINVSYSGLYSVGELEDRFESNGTAFSVRLEIENPGFDWFQYLVVGLSLAGVPTVAYVYRRRRSGVA